MKKVGIGIITVIIAAYIIVVVIININKGPKEESNKTKIVTSFYPVYVMTLNITKGAENVEVSNMAEHLTGCIHDYTLTTEDLKKFEKASIFIQNGAGLENFTDKILNSYQNIKVISAAENVQNFICEGHDHDSHDNEEQHEHNADEENVHNHEESHDHDEECNSHIWLSIENYISEVEKIYEKLSEYDSKNKETYLNNKNTYIEKLNALKIKYKGLENIQNKGAICLDEALVYLLDEVGMKYEIVETDHEQSSISANQIKELINQMKKENITSIFIEKDGDTKVAETLAKETGAKIYKLDAEMNPSKNYEDINAYIEAMEFNYKVLSEV